ncbi:uncharacterized protein [Watersipora subatra]|uniref:uncharacterized protein n=1 Tax=Watersipora subatra TaxID=2589382 RepID=UPI00355C2C02
MSSVNKRKRSAYDASFKLKVVQYAETCINNRKTAAEFGISEKQVRDWRKIKLELLEMPRHKKARRGLQTSFLNEENELKNWILNLRQEGYIVTRSAIRLKAKELIADPSFKASAGWCGLISVLQPLDVSLNHPFKCRVRNQWTRWMSSGAAELTTSGNFKRPSLTTVVTWVKTAWDSIEAPMIEKSFKKCSISNNFDGTENEILWTDQVNDTNEDTDDENEICDDILTEEQAKKLFEDSSDEEEFHGF